MVKEFFAVLAKEFERAERASVINKVKDVDFLCGYELPKEFVVVARGLFGGTVTVNGRYT